MQRAQPATNRPRPTLTQRRAALALAAVRHLSRADARLRAIIRRVGPHRPRLTRDPFVALAGSIIHQQISMSAAVSVQRKLIALLPARRLAPPALLALSTDQLRSAGLSRQKVAYLHELAAHFHDGRLQTRALRRMPDDQAIEAVTAVHGVGRWTAQMLLMFCLERPDVWPIADLGLQAAVARLLRLRSRPTPRQMESAAIGWTPYRSYASWYLWRSLEGPLMPGIDLRT